MVASRPVSDTTGRAVQLGLHDLGNGKWIADQYADALRYIRTGKRWIYWDERRWAPDDTGEAERRAKAIVAALLERAIAATEDAERKLLIRHAEESCSARAIADALKLAATEAPLAMRAGDFDRGPLLLNVENGTLDLQTATLRPHCRSDYLTKLVPIRFDPNATAPRWERFLREIMHDDPALISYLQRVVGCALSGLNPDQAWFFLFGSGANGKSTLLDVVRALLGDYARQADTATFVKRRADAIRNDLARLAGARLVTAVELEEGQHLAASLIKQLTGGDAVTSRFLYAEYAEHVPGYKIVIAGNHRPRVDDTTFAFWRRTRLVPFTVTIPVADQDPHLAAALKRELPGILAWAVGGCLEWQRRGLAEPPAIALATEAYQREQDLVGGFLVEGCLEDRDATVVTTDLYAAYERYCQESGTEQLGRREFHSRLEEKGFVRGRKVKGSRSWRGLRLKLDAAEEADDAAPPF